MVNFFRKSTSFSMFLVTRSDNNVVSDFYLSSWQRGESAAPMFALRLFLMLGALTILFWSWIEGMSFYWFIYLTNWGILLMAITMVTAFRLSSAYLGRENEDAEEDEDERRMFPWYVSMYWVLMNITTAIIVMITIFYWTMIYNPKTYEKVTHPKLALWYDISTHGLTSFIMLIELIMSRTPLRIAHLYQPMLIAIFYLFFSLIYHGAGGTDGKGNKYIYEIVNWDDSKGSFLLVLAALLGLILIYFMLMGLVISRDSVSSAICRTRTLKIPS